MPVESGETGEIQASTFCSIVGCKANKELVLKVINCLDTHLFLVIINVNLEDVCM